VRSSRERSELERLVVDDRAVFVGFADYYGNPKPRPIVSEAEFEQREREIRSALQALPSIDVIAYERDLRSRYRIDDLASEAEFSADELESASAQLAGVPMDM